MCFAFAEEAVMAGETGECNLPRGIKEAPSIRRKEISLLSVCWQASARA